MGMLVLAGKKANLIGRAADLGQITSSPAADVLNNPAVDPLVYLGDGQASAPAVFGSIVADSYFQADLNEVPNGGFETSTLSGWVDADVAAGTSNETTTGAEVHSGTKALECIGTSGSDVGRRYRDIEVRSGELRTLDAWLRAVTGTANVYLQNLINGKYLQSGGASWAASRNACLTHNTSTYTLKTVPYQVESLDALQADTVFLRIYLESSAGAAEVQFDDVADYPAFNFSSVHGHNVDQAVTLQLLSDDNSGFSSATTQATFTIKRPSFYTTFATVRERYVRLKFGGSNLLLPPYVGEWVLGQATTLSVGVKLHSATESAFRQVRHETTGGERWRYGISPEPSRRFSIDFVPVETSAKLAEITDDFWRRSAGGLYSAVIVPRASAADVMFGILGPAMTVDPSTPWINEVRTLDFEELPFPVVGL